jgi:prolyl-tRNA synthetase
MFLPDITNPLHPSHQCACQLLERGGYLQQTATNVYALLPPALFILQKIKTIISQEMQSLEGQEIMLPLLTSATTWEATKRAGSEERSFVQLPGGEAEQLLLATAHEQSAMALFAKLKLKLEQLPLFFYQYQIGLGPVPSHNHHFGSPSEYLSHDSFSLHRSFSCLNNFVPKIFQAYQNIFKYLRLPVVVANSLAKQCGGDYSYEFYYLHPHGTDGVISCPHCAYQASQEAALGTKPCPTEPPLTLTTMVRTTPGSMASLVRELGVPSSRIAQSTLYWGSEHAILAVYRGDQIPSINKISRLCSTPVNRAATNEELSRLGLEPDFLSPIGLSNRRLSQKNLIIVVDRLVAESPNLIFPANNESSYFIHGNFGRDFDAQFAGDICRIGDDYNCFQCGQPLHLDRAVKLGHILPIGSYHARKLDLRLPASKPVAYPNLGIYGININLLLYALVDNNRCNRGFIWPGDFTPVKACLIPVGWSFRVSELCQKIYAKHQDILLYADQNEPFLGKCRHADYIGIRLRIIINQHSVDTDMAFCIDSLTHTKEKIPLKLLRSFLLEKTTDPSHDNGEL